MQYGIYRCASLGLDVRNREGGNRGKGTCTLRTCRMQGGAQPCWVQIVSLDVVIHSVGLYRISLGLVQA